MDFQAALQHIWQLHQQLGGRLDAGLLVFARLLGFMLSGPVFSRRDIPFIVKVVFSIFLATLLVGIIPVNASQLASIHQHTGLFVAVLMVNATLGLVLGFLANLILLTIQAAGSMVNSQIGLSSAMIFDPSTRTQSMVLEPFFAFLGMALFIYLGGLQWQIAALQHSFQVFPLTALNPHLPSRINVELVSVLTANVLDTATLLAAPVMVITMAVDIILGIVNRTAQQMPVFQLSFALKPCIGIGVFLATLPVFLQVVMQFLLDYQKLY